MTLQWYDPDVASRPIEYLSPQSPGIKRRISMRGIAIAAVVLAILVFWPTVPFKAVESRIDAITGTITWKTTYLGGIRTSTRVDVSPLEKRLKEAGIAWTPSPTFLHNVPRDMFGRAICYECGSAPAIYSLRPVLQDFVDASTDDELRQFVQIMQAGNAVQQLEAVESASEKGLQHMRGAK